MSLEYVFDSSAILALLHEEPGASFVERHMTSGLMSAVNVSEVIQKADQHGVWEPGIEDDLQALGIRYVDFTPADARLAAAIWSAAPKSGLSFADRACLALAVRLGLPAVTADRVWARAMLDIEIIDLRDSP